MKSRGNGKTAVSSRLQGYLATPNSFPRRQVRCGFCTLRDERPDIYRDVLTLFVSGWRRGMVQRYLQSIGITALTRNQFDQHFITHQHYESDTLPPPLPSSLAAQLEALPDDGE